MKFKLIITTFLLSLFVAGSVYAIPYSVNFDPDGTGAQYSSKEIWGFDTEGIIQYAVGSTLVNSSTWIEQDLGLDGILGNGDTFTEKFTTLVLNGYNSAYAGQTPVYWGDDQDDLKIDINLAGYISGYNAGAGGTTTRINYWNIANDSYYTNMNAGTAAMYVDMNENNIYDGGDTLAANFSFANAAPAFLGSNVWPGSTGSANFSVAFKLDSYNTDFWTDGSFPTPLADLVAAGFVFTYNEGSAKALGIAGNPTSPDNKIILGFDDNGIDIKFDAVPEPATMLLFGIGLLGLAGVSRKKSIK